MKKVMLYRPDGTLMSDKPVHVVARNNGISAKQVPSLVAAWQSMGAITPRSGGGYVVKKFVAEADPIALKLMIAIYNSKTI